MKTLICIIKDGELCLRPVNPHSQYYYDFDGKSKNWDYDDFERTVQAYPIHNLAIQPGETIDADKVVLVWQFRHAKTSNWLTSTLKDDFPNISFEQYKKDNEVVSGFETRQAYTALSPKEPQYFGRDPVIYDTTDYKEPQKKDVTLLEGGEEINRDWTEDFHLENGNYQNVCISCKNLFMGYKRRSTCKKCATEATIEFKAQKHCEENGISHSGSLMFIQGAKFGEKVYEEQITILKEQIIELVCKNQLPL